MAGDHPAGGGKEYGYPYVRARSRLVDLEETAARCSRSGLGEGELAVSEHHHVEFMLQRVDGLRRESWGEAQRRAHLREALDERRGVRTRGLRTLISGLICRWSRRSSAPCSDASVRPAQ